MKLGDFVNCVLEGSRAAKPKIGFWWWLSGEWILNDGRTIDKEDYGGNMMLGRGKGFLDGLFGSLLGGALRECKPYLGAPAGVCDQEVCPGQRVHRQECQRQVKSCREMASPWISAQILPLPWGNYSKSLPATVTYTGRCEPKIFSHTAQSHSDSPSSCPTPAYPGLLVYHEQFIITSESQGVVGQSQRNIWL